MKHTLIAVAAGVISALTAGSSVAADAPHTATCLECHQTHVQFGNQIGAAFGNANECQSCHQAGGVAHAKPMAETDQAQPWPGLPANHPAGGRSHRWDSSPSGRVVPVGESPAEALISSGLYTGRYPKTYTVTIVSEGDAGTAQFNWSGSTPGGGGAAGIGTGSSVPLESGLALTFLNVRTNAPGFHAGDSWLVIVRPGLTPPSNPDMLAHTPGGSAVCSTCHDQHSQLNEPFDPAAPAYTDGVRSNGRHFMRINSDQDQMCAECHGSRFVTNSAAGSHPVGVLVPNNAFYQAPQTLPMDKIAGRMRCSTCHQVHHSTSDDGNLLRVADSSQLCRECHNLADTNAPAIHLNPMTTPLWPGGQYGSLFPALTDPRQRGACGTCHRIHGWPDPSTVSSNNASLLVEKEENLCYTCHDGSPVAKNIRANFAKTYTHPVSLSGRHSTTEDGVSSRYGTANRHAECPDCHNVHQLMPDYATAPAPYGSAALQGVPRVSVNNISASQITYTYRSPSDPTPVKEYELCFVCHSSWTTQPAGQTNYAAVFNTKNPSFHPVEAAALDAGINPATFVNGWAPGMLVKCTHCHTSDDTTIRGPHGSANQWILKKPYIRANSPALPSNGLCYDCHSSSVYNTGGSALSRFKGVGERAGHTHGGYNCYACHESHGSTAKPFLLGHSVTVYTKTATGGTCDPSCHGSESYTVSYPR